MKTLKLPYYLLSLLFLCICSCNSPIDYTGEEEDIDDMIFSSIGINELSLNTIDEKIKDVKLNTETGVYGNLYANPYDTVSITIDGLFNEETPTKRLFSYYIPQNLSDNYRLMFEFHGNFVSTDFYNYSVRQCLIIETEWQKLADMHNTVIIVPIGSIKNKTYGWNINCGDLYYTDILIALFKKQIKENRGLNLDTKSIYATGTSSGGIFSWGLTYYRNNLFTVTVPRFGSVRSNATMLYKKPTNKIPMMIITGKKDTDTAPYEAVLSNADIWLRKMYNTTVAMEQDSIENMKWKNITTKVWINKYRMDSGFFETFLIEEAAHSDIDETIIYPMIFDFMINNTRK